MRLNLKIKIKSLAAEAKIIRQEERKYLKHARACESEEHAEEHRFTMRSLQSHRKGGVRSEQRCSLLAYGFLKGMPYKRMEQSCRENNKPNWDTIEKMAIRFGADQRDIKQRFAEWKDEALNEKETP